MMLILIGEYSFTYDFTDSVWWQTQFFKRFDFVKQTGIIWGRGGEGGRKIFSLISPLFFHLSILPIFFN